MAHFVKLNQNNEVVDIIVVSNDDINNLPFPESEPVGILWIQNWSGDTSSVWKQTSYNANFRRAHAGIGYVYDADKDAFVLPKPYPSWIFNEDLWIWEPPIPYPTGDKYYVWNEETTSWIETNNG